MATTNRPPGLDSPTIADILSWRAEHQPDLTALIFLEDGESKVRKLSFSELGTRARRLARDLRQNGKPGDPVLLLLEPSLDYAIAFYSCFYANRIAVPVYPPNPARLAKTLPPMLSIVQNSGARQAIVSPAAAAGLAHFFNVAPELETIEWISTEVSHFDDDDPFTPPPCVDGRDIAFLQYTSGSTGNPKGVMISHENIIRNCAVNETASEIGPAFNSDGESGVYWLPPYHDLGLMNGIVAPVYGGATAVLMSPMHFLQRPMRWLKAMSKYKATLSAGPNFAYDLCARKATPEDIENLDLSAWRLASIGAELVRPSTIDLFVRTFEPCGFRAEILRPGYGLAESTLSVTLPKKGNVSIRRTFDAEALETGRVLLAGENDRRTRTLVDSGDLVENVDVRIVDPEDRIEVGESEIGEVWVSSESVGQGYWRNPKETARVFGARLTDSGEGPFLRTGDLGFKREGYLFLTGRIKDLIIIRGQNRDPSDIEQAVDSSSPLLRPGCGAAFSIELDDEERLVIVHEARNSNENDIEGIVKSVRTSVINQHDVEPYDIRIIKPRTVPKTTSGKIQRRACKRLYLEGDLDLI